MLNIYKFHSNPSELIPPDISDILKRKGLDDSNHVRSYDLVLDDNLPFPYDSVLEVQLKDGLTVDGSLWLPRHHTTLPNNLTVGKNLNLSGTSVRVLPENLTVGGSLDLNGTPIEKEDLPSSLVVKGKIRY